MRPICVNDQTSLGSSASQAIQAQNQSQTALLHILLILHLKTPSRKASFEVKGAQLYDKLLWQP